VTAAPGAAVFLDRDGVLIRDVHYLCRVEQMGPGKLTEPGLREIHRLLSETLRADGAELDAIYCPHHPTAAIGAYKVACACRKPNAAMIEHAARDLSLDPKNSYLVGDQAGDMELAARVGAQGVLISQATTVGSADIAGAEPTLDNLLQAAPMDRQPNWAGRLEARES